MPILVRSDDIRSGSKAKARHGRLRVAQESMGYLENLESPGILLRLFPGLSSPGKRPLVLESSGNLLNSAKK